MASDRGEQSLLSMHRQGDAVNANKWIKWLRVPGKATSSIFSALATRLCTDPLRKKETKLAHDKKYPKGS